MIYLDDTAVATLITSGADAKELRSYLQDHTAQRWFTLALTRVALARDHGLTAEQLSGLDSLDTVEITERLLADTAAVPAGIGLIDALHIAAAQTAGERLHVFITGDPVRAQAARAAQLRVHELRRKNAQ